MIVLSIVAGFSWGRMHLTFIRLRTLFRMQTVWLLRPEMTKSWLKRLSMPGSVKRRKTSSRLLVCGSISADVDDLLVPDVDDSDVDVDGDNFDGLNDNGLDGSGLSGSKKNARRPNASSLGAQPTAHGNVASCVEKRVLLE